MSSPGNREPVERWSADDPQEGVDASLGALFRAVPRRGPLPDAALNRVRVRLSRGRPKRRWMAMRELSLAIAMVIGGAGAALAEWAQPGWWQPARAWFSSERFDPAPRAEVLGPSRAPGGIGPQEPQPESSAPAPSVTALPSVAEPPVAARVGLAPSPSSRVIANDTAPGEPAPPRPAPIPAAPSDEESGESRSEGAKPSALARESQAIERALTQLHREHDARGALRSLDEYTRAFPDGALLAEAATARIEALLSLGDRPGALAELNRLPLERVARRAEFQVLRGELLAEQECPRAIADFDTALNLALSSPLAERALYGRAACRLRLGDAQGGRGDLATYLSRYPNGRFAREVRARLAVP